MAGLPVRDPAVDRSLRSVFVGNIPYEATEEQLKDIFSEVGPVVSFRLVYDRETGKPKGYGFCEYQDQETALSAMRNLNGREFSGRALRVDNAASEKNKEELKSLGTGAPVIESPYGETISPEDAPESISKAVASLPPEQMFELMKQMKLCVQNSPQEARNMLLQNPQLAYALLQAQVVMRIVDPEIALKILHRQTNIPTLISGNPQPVHVGGPGSGPSVSMNQQNPQAPQAQSLVGLYSSTFTCLKVFFSFQETILREEASGIRDGWNARQWRTSYDASSYAGWSSSPSANDSCCSRTWPWLLTPCRSNASPSWNARSWTSAHGTRTRNPTALTRGTRRAYIN